MRFTLVAPVVLLTIFAHLSAQEESLSCQTPNNIRVDIRHIEAGGIGYGQGYSTGALFAIAKHSPRGWYPFLDLRGHAFNNGRFAANAGLGLRYERNGFLYGVNTYYDYRNQHRFHSNQVGGGLEFFSKRLEARVNGYFPVGKTKSRFFGGSQFNSFQGNYMYVSQRQTHTFTGVDGEIAGRWPNCLGWDFLTGAGPYYLERSGQNVYGGKGRIRASYKQYAFLELSGSYDNVFHGQIQGQIGFSIPLGPKSFWREPSSSAPFCQADLQRVSAPYRIEIIPFKTEYKRNPNPVVNPATGLPWFFIFVDNTSHSAGTFESPFPDLASAQAASGPNDVIYVFPGDGTTTGLTSGFVMQNGQQLLGTSFAYNFSTTNSGTILVPAMSATRPHLSRTDALAVTITNNCTVSGLYITSAITAAGTRISAIGNTTAAESTGNASLSNPTVTNNYIEQTQTSAGTAGYTIRLANITGVGTVSGNQINVVASGSSVCRPLYTDLYGTTCALTVANNNITYTGATNTTYVIRVAPDSSALVNVAILNNTVAATSSGIQANIIIRQGNGAQSTALIQGNTCTGTTNSIGDGIFIASIGSGTACTATILSNTVAVDAQSSFGAGIHLQTTGGASSITSTIQNNTTSLGLIGINPDVEAGSQVCSVLNNTSISNTRCIEATTVNAGSSLCLRCQGNIATPTSSTILLSAQAGTTYNLEPLVGNTGTLSTSGTITNVSQGFCGN